MLTVSSTYSFGTQSRALFTSTIGNAPLPPHTIRLPLPLDAVQIPHSTPLPRQRAFRHRLRGILGLTPRARRRRLPAPRADLQRYPTKLLAWQFIGRRRIRIAQREMDGSAACCAREAYEERFRETGCAR